MQLSCLHWSCSGNNVDRSIVTNCVFFPLYPCYPLPSPCGLSLSNIRRLSSSEQGPFVQHHAHQWSYIDHRRRRRHLFNALEQNKSGNFLKCILSVFKIHSSVLVTSQINIRQGSCSLLFPLQCIFHILMHSPFQLYQLSQRQIDAGDS